MAAEPVIHARRPAQAIEPEALVGWFRRNRARTAAIFGMVSPSSRLARPIALRHPIIFYEGHLSVFYVNTILVKGLGAPGIDPELERLFARGIDPEDEAAAASRAIDVWPSQGVLEAYIRAADEAVEAALRSEDILKHDNPVMAGGQAVFATLEHEAMHQETLLYILHRLPRGQLLNPGPFPEPYRPVGSRPDRTRVRIEGGPARLGTDRASAPFGWDNEFPSHEVEVKAFALDVHDVTNADFLAFVEAGGYQAPEWWSQDDWAWRSREQVDHPSFWERRGESWYWRGLLADVPLPPAWPVYVTHAEAGAYARWKGGRLPTEAEYQRAAFATPDGTHRMFPWGDEPPDATRGNFDFMDCDPAPAGSWPAGVSAWGVHDLVGNGWEWTSTIFEPFPGFEPMASYPEYSADFFDRQHYVIKGASPATARELLRPGLRNWFRPQYPYVYATFRLAWDD